MQSATVAVPTYETAAARWVLVATIVASSMVFIDGAIVNIALPVLERDLGATMSDAQWIVEIYMLSLSSLILVGGSAGDLFGRRRVFGYGVLLFAAMSLWCGFASSVRQLIIARALQGVGGALMVPGSLALISASFHEERRGRAIGMWSGFTTVAAGVGPVVGGFLIQHASWRWAFWLNVPLAAVVLLVTYARVPESRGGNHQGSRAQPEELDIAGAVIVSIGLGLIIYSLIEAGTRGLGDPVLIATLIAGIVALVLFIRHEQHAREPMIPLELFRSRAFTGANILTLLLYGALSGVMFFLPFNLLQVQRYSASQAGAAMLPFIVIMFLLARWAGGIVTRYGARLPLIIGPIIVSVSLLLLMWPGIGGSYWTTFFPGILLMGLGMAVSVVPLTTTVMNAVEERYVGTASGVNNAVSRVAGLLAIALFSLIATKIFNPDLDRHLAPLQLPAEARAEIDRQRVKLAGAEPPHDLPESQRAAVALAIKASFVDSFRIVMLLAAALALASAGATAVTLKDR